MEDCKIVDLYWARDEDAIVQTQIKYERYLTKIAFNILSDHEDSAESVNDTYLRAWNSMPDNRPDLLSTYLGKICRRLAIDMYRKKTADKRGGSEYEVSLQELAENGIEPAGAFDNDSEFKQLGSLISEYLRTISAEQRTVFVSRYFHCDPLKDICARTGYSESKIKSMLFRVRGGLKKYLEKEGYTI